MQCGCSAILSHRFWGFPIFPNVGTLPKSLKFNPRKKNETCSKNSTYDWFLFCSAPDLKVSRYLVVGGLPNAHVVPLSDCSLLKVGKERRVSQGWGAGMSNSLAGGTILNWRRGGTFPSIRLGINSLFLRGEPIFAQHLTVYKRTAYPIFLWVKCNRGQSHIVDNNNSNNKMK